MVNSDQTNGDFLVPVANAVDTRETAQVLHQYSPRQVTVLNIVDKKEGVPDKKLLEQSEQIAADLFDVFRTVFPDADEHITYGRAIAGAIIEVAKEIGACAIVFWSRVGNRIMHFLSGDLSMNLITKADRPVITLPKAGLDQ